MTSSQAATLNASINFVPATPARTSTAAPARILNAAVRETAREAILLGLGSVGFLAGVTLLINALFANLM